MIAMAAHPNSVPIHQKCRMAALQPACLHTQMCRPVQHATKAQTTRHERRPRQPVEWRRQRPAAAAAAAALDDTQREDGDDTPWAEMITDLLDDEGSWDASCPRLQACVQRGSELTQWLAGEEGVSIHLALELAMVQCRLEAADSSLDDSGRGETGRGSGNAGSSEEPSPATAGAGLLHAKFAVFRRLTSAEPGWATSLGRVLTDSDEAAALPAADTAAALAFATAQLQRLSRRRYEQLRSPITLPRLFLLHPGVGAALLAQHPAAFSQRADPWLRRSLGWGDSQVADAALTDSFDRLCQLDVGAAQAALDWLQGPAGLSRQQAGRLLAPPGLRLLLASPAQLAAEGARVEKLSAAWGVGPGLAAALVLAQPPLSASGMDRTGQLAGTLVGTVGMSEGQALEFVLNGGLDGGCTQSEAALDRATGRLKDLLLVHGSWPGVAAALCEHPDLLTISWQGLGSLLEGPRQRAAWRAVADMQLAAMEGG